MKQFVSVNDVENVDALVRDAIALKNSPMLNVGVGKTLGLLFFNPSLRTRLSTQKAAMNIGMSVMVMNVGADGWKIEFEDGTVMDGDHQEHIKDTVKVVSGYCDILGVRTFASLKDRQKDYQEEVLSQFLKYSSCPIVSLESATLHPLQSLADLITIRESGIQKPKVAVSWAPHPKALPQAVTNSFMEWMLKTDAQLTLTHPEGYELNQQFTKGVQIEYDQNKALEGADFVYVKNWSSYNHYGQILSTDMGWTITEDKMKLTNEGRLMHCLPIRRNVIATDEVLDEHSLIYEQAKNREYSAQIVLQKILAGHG